MENDKMNGYSKQICWDGEIKEYNWKDGKRHGEMKTTIPNYRIKKVTYENGKKIKDSYVEIDIRNKEEEEKRR